MKYHSKKLEKMRTLLLTLLLGLIGYVCFSQTDAVITEKRNVYNDKGDYYFDRNEFKKAIVYYTMAFQKDATDYFSILKKAEAYSKLKLYPQAEECYRIVFESNQRPDNVYRLKYALVLLANNKPEEFKRWITEYNEIIEEEIEGENYLISTEQRTKLYKDSTIVLTKNKENPDSIHFKIKYEGYRYKRRSSQDENKINLWLSNGEEYNISPNSEGDYEFSFQPAENYKLIIQRENVECYEIFDNKNLTAEQRKMTMLKPSPVQKAEIIVPQGMKYTFSAGDVSVSPQYLSTLKGKAKEYQDAHESSISLTALAKELRFFGADVYTFRFVKDEEQGIPYKGKEVSTLYINEKSVSVFGRSFFIMLPLKTEANFTIKTDLDALDQNFSPKKYSLVVDDGPVFKKEEAEPEWLLILAVNTDSIDEVNQDNRLSAKEISIIPGTEYMLTLSKPDPATGKDIEIIVPLTRGVKYNLSSSAKSDTEFKEALAEFLIGRHELKLADEEVIDITILSKELEVQPGEDLSFRLLPVKQPGKKLPVAEDITSSLTLDERAFEISPYEKYTINIPFNPDRKVNFHTDLDYVQENFEADAYNLNLDTISFFSEITVDTTGLGARRDSGWLSMSVNTHSAEEVESKNQLTAREVSIIPAKEYILTVSKMDAETGEEEEIIVPLTRHVKYDFTAHPASRKEYRKSLNKFLAEQEDIKTIDAEVIDITLLSKELQIQEGDQISLSLLPVRDLTGKPPTELDEKSSLYLDNKIVEFTHIQKYTINVPLGISRQVNMQTDLEHLNENFEPGSYTLNIDTIEFFAEIIIDTTGLGDRISKEEEVIKDPVFDVVIVNFDLNDYSLSSGAKNIIQKSVIDELAGDNRLYVTIKGYTDALGDSDYNLNLSKKRAESVKEFLKSKGIGDNRIRTFSFGAAQLLEENVNWKEMDESELRKYRKVEIVIYLPE